jgi:hypothetical protein
MSTYSDQINIILQGKLIPKMQLLAKEISSIEPYSFSSDHLEELKRQSDYYSMIYDFLMEYSTGEEELDNGKLVNITRLIDSPTRERRNSDYLSLPVSVSQSSKAGYRLYVDSKELTVASAASSYLTPGTTVSITLVYTPTSLISGVKSISATLGSIDQTSGGFNLVFQNVVIPISAGGSSLTITAVAKEDGVNLSPVQTFVLPITQTIDNVLYYGEGTIGLTPAQIQMLNVLYEEKGPKTVIFNPSNEVLYFAYPTQFGVLSSIVDQNDFDITNDFVRTTQAFTLTSPNYGTGVSNYYIYESINLLTVSNFSITFNF